MRKIGVLPDELRKRFADLLKTLTRHERATSDLVTEVATKAIASSVTSLTATVATNTADIATLSSSKLATTKIVRGQVTVSFLNLATTANATFSDANISASTTVVASLQDAGKLADSPFIATGVPSSGSVVVNMTRAVGLGAVDYIVQVVGVNP